MTSAFGGFRTGCWTPVTLHAYNGACNSVKQVPCENVETPERETTEITMESQMLEVGGILTFLTIFWIPSSYLAYIVIRFV